MPDINAHRQADGPYTDMPHLAAAPAWSAQLGTPWLFDSETTPCTSHLLGNDENPVDWTEEDVVYLHWRLLQDVSSLSDPDTPLEDKLDTLRWVFTEREKDGRPFSFTSCLRVVGCSPLSPIPYCGLVDPEEIRDHIRAGLRVWMSETLARYPQWVRDAVQRNPEWVEQRLTKNPQWINEQLKKLTVQSDLFA
ncbi:hypothetical protein [Sphaerotilus sp.]|uniref:hypothetical protein n=1 Tax=Sphaerotilus sp. TaxID=2093942 RepID=UPI002ACDAB21|nr:hypothetical protein [Sphaerotilus sp.]MDZ7855916.1 hypothetical protein [Sphaerotilus sp.]